MPVCKKCKQKISTGDDTTTIDHGIISEDSVFETCGCELEHYHSECTPNSSPKQIETKDIEPHSEINVFVEMHYNEIQSIRLVDNPNLVKSILEESESAQASIGSSYKMHHFRRQIEF